VRRAAFGFLGYVFAEKSTKCTKKSVSLLTKAVFFDIITGEIEYPLDSK
jgi:hypothetical protein